MQLDFRQAFELLFKQASQKLQVLISRYIATSELHIKNNLSQKNQIAKDHEANGKALTNWWISAESYRREGANATKI